MPLMPNDIPMSEAEVSLAKERGRLRSLARLMVDPVRRAEVEARFGLSFCQRKWPELYATGRRPVSQLWRDFMNRTFGAYGRSVARG